LFEAISLHEFRSKRLRRGTQELLQSIPCDDALLPCRDFSSARLHESHKPARQLPDAVRLSQLDGFSGDQRDAHTEGHSARQDKIRRRLLIHPAGGD
jgi:hypothetical protein